MRFRHFGHALHLILRKAVSAMVAETGDIPPSSTDTVTAMSHDVSRRRFLTIAVVAAATAPVALRSMNAEAAAPAAPAALPKLAPTDATAKALGYIEDATKAKHAAFKPGSSCANCNFFKGAKGAATGPCTIFPKNSVVAKGWCSAYAKKP